MLAVALAILKGELVQSPNAEHNEKIATQEKVRPFLYGHQRSFAYVYKHIKYCLIFLVSSYSFSESGKDIAYPPIIDPCTVSHSFCGL